MKKNVCLSRLLLSVLPVLAALVMASCTRHSEAWPQLLEAEKLLETDLPTAGAMIDSVDASLLHGEDAALYAILKTQADYKRYLPLTSDSLPRLAADFYGTPYRKNYRAAMAWYSLGCTYLDQRDDLKAIDALLKAKTLYTDTLSRYYALCQQQLGKLYLLHHLYSQSLEEFLSYKRTVTQIADSALIDMADYFCSLSDIRLQRFEEAKSLLIPLTDTVGSAFVYYDDVLFQLAKVEYFLGNIEASDDYLSSCMLSTDNKASQGVVYLFKGNICYDVHQYDSAYQYYSAALHCQNDLNTQCELNKMLLASTAFLQDPVSSSVYAKEYTMLLDSIYRQSKKSEIATIQSSHIMESKAQEQRAVRERFALITLIVALLILSSGTIAILSYHRKKEKQYIAFSEKMRSSLCAQIELQAAPLISDQEPEGDVHPTNTGESDTDQRVSSLREERIQYCREQFSQSEWASYMRKNASSILAEEYMPPSDRETFRCYVSKLFSELTLELTRESQKMNVDNLYLCQLCMLGFTGKAIGYCMGATAHSVYCRKSRIREHLNAEWRKHVFESSEEPCNS